MSKRSAGRRTGLTQRSWQSLCGWPCVVGRSGRRRGVAPEVAEVAEGPGENVHAAGKEGTAAGQAAR